MMIDPNDEDARFVTVQIVPLPSDLRVVYKNDDGTE